MFHLSRLAPSLGSLALSLVVACGGSNQGSGQRNPSSGGGSGGDGAGGTTSGTGGTGSPGDVLHVEGRFVLDTCGNRFLARGMEQITGSEFSSDGTLLGIVRELGATGSNAVRILPEIDSISVAELDEMLTAFAAERIVVYISPGDRTWFLREDVRAMLLTHERGLVIDAFQEPDYWDIPRWVEDAQGAIVTLREAGYRCPLTALSNGYGRDLPAALENGQAIFDADPLRNTIIGWQAYWGNSGWYQGEYGMSLEQGVAACAAQVFPMQAGIDLEADPGDVMDYAAVMAAAEEHQLGWLWWDWWNPFGSVSSASTDGTAANLSPAGEAVIDTDPNSIRRTATKACFE